MLTSAVVLSLSLSSRALSAQRPNSPARALLPRQSASPCVYNICPDFDGDGSNVIYNDTEDNTLTCTYPDGTCTFDTTSGLLTGGTDPFCLGMATMGGCSRRRAQFKREDNLTAVRRKVAARKALGATERAERAKEAAKRAMDAAQSAEEEAKRAIEDAARANEEIVVLA